MGVPTCPSLFYNLDTTFLHLTPRLTNAVYNFLFLDDFFSRQGGGEVWVGVGMSEQMGFLGMRIHPYFPPCYVK